MAGTQSIWVVLPYRVDHVGSEGTRWERYKLIESKLPAPKAEHWTQIDSA